MQRTLPPYSLAAEQSVLGAMILDEEKALEVASYLTDHDFYEPTHVAIFRGMMELLDDDKPIDLLTVTQQLCDHDCINKAGGSSYIAALTVNVLPNTMQHARIVRDKAIHRNVIQAGHQISAFGAQEDVSAEQLLEQVETTVLQLSPSDGENETVAASALVDSSYDRVVQRRTGNQSVGLSTGFADLDRKLEGLHPGDCIVIAARPSMGKTALATNIAASIASHGKTVAFFSLEMGKERIMDRIIGSVVGNAKTKDELEAFRPQIEAMKEWKLFFNDDGETTISGLCSKARRHALRHGIDLLVLDYLQLVGVADDRRSENRTQQLAEITRRLKTLATQLGIPVVVLSQLNREVERRSPPIPVLSDLRDSGSIEQDADIVLMLYRDDYYNEDSAQAGVTDVFVRKHRNGDVGSIQLFFDRHRTQFHSIDYAHSFDGETKHRSKASLPSFA